MSGFDYRDEEVLGHPDEIRPLAEYIQKKFGGDNQIGDLAYKTVRFLGKLWFVWLNAENSTISQLQAVVLLARNCINEGTEEVEQLERDGGE